PEIRWIFGMYVGKTDADWFPIGCEHSLLAFSTAARRDPLFDPTGLRQWVRKRTNWALAKMGEFQLSIRVASAAAIDEERPYAYLHAYTAYRFGYRADVVSTWALLKERFDRPRECSGGHGYQLLLEDMSLNLPDRPAGIHLLHLDERATHFPLLN